MTLRDLAVIRGTASPVVLNGAPSTRATTSGSESTAATDDTEQDVTDGMPIMVVRFATFGDWYPVSSWWEGEFIERLAAGAFAKTIAESGNRSKVLFDHGCDWHIGDKILGVPTVLEERDDSPYAEVPLLDTTYCRDLAPGLHAGGYGASFMFHVMREEWNREPAASEANPDALPERTITEVRLLEFGPVTWPANPNASAGLRNCRSGTDWFTERLRGRQPERWAAYTRRLNDFRAELGLGPRTPDVDAARMGTSADGAASISTDAPDPVLGHHPTGLSAGRRERALALLTPVPITGG